MISAPTKKEIRKNYLMRRERLARTHPEHQEALNTALLAWLETEKVASLGFYWPFRAEPDISPAITKWLQQDFGRRAALPVVEDKEACSMHYAVWSATAAMRVGVFGIAIPKEDVKLVPDIVFAPCIAFNSHGYRLGAGAGYFDRYLARRLKEPMPPVMVAVAFDALRCEDFEPEPHDVSFDWIATESGVWRVGENSD